MERFGVRRVMLLALATISLGAGLTTVMDTPWQLDLLDWRWAPAVVVCVAMLLVFPVVALVVRDRPQSIGLQPYGAPEPVPVEAPAARPFRPAIDVLLLGVRSRTFWLLSASFFICGSRRTG
jgi:hypothetical protein